MPTKARFQGSKAAPSKNANSGSGSKRAINGGAISGFPVKASGGNIQVIHNGKIVTPQSLLPRRIQAQPSGKEHNSIIDSSIHKKNVESEAESNIEKLKGSGEYGFKKSHSVGKSEVSHPSAARSSAINLTHVKIVEEFVTVVIEETETEIILSLPSLTLSNEVRELNILEEKNAKYESLIEAHKNKDGFSSKPTQTINNPQKHQNDMVAPNASQDFGCQAMAFDILDATKKNTSTSTDGDVSLAGGGGADGADADRASNLSSYVQKYVSNTVNLALSTPGCILDVSAAGAGNTGAANSTVTGGGKAAGSKNQGKGPDTKSRNAGTDWGGGQEAPIRESQHSDSDGNGVSGHQSESGDAATLLHHNDDFDGESVLRERNVQQILTSKGLLKKLQMMERATQQNAYHKHILDYRDFPEIKLLELLSSADKAVVVDSLDKLFSGGGLGNSIGRSLSPSGHNPDIFSMNAASASAAGAHVHGQGNAHMHDSSADGQGLGPGMASKDQGSSTPSAKKLFSFSAPALVKGRPITAMSWNAENTDLLAVGYGQIDFLQDSTQKTITANKDDDAAGGLVLFWSLRNPDYPEKVLTTSHPVTALDFSKRNPTLLAVGLYNGDIAVYNVRREEGWSKPVESSASMIGGHSDPVWQVKWVSKGQDSGEILVSISTDGNVLQWSLKKGLLVSLLMQLKRGGAGEGWISRQASGLCFDFAPNDSGTYITGTEEGHVHRCSVSYNEQYLESYNPHSGPVYRINFSPWWHDVFLSCSADWNVHLYHLRSTTPLLTFHSTGEDFAVNDICWAPKNSTVFGAVTGDAKLQIWDLSVSDIDPVISIDTNADVEVQSEDSAAAYHTDSVQAAAGGGKAKTPASMNASNRRDVKDARDEDKDAPVSTLLKHLCNGSDKRTLTSLVFAHNSPVVVVGDNRGHAAVYRVNHPNIMTDVSIPAEQTRLVTEAVYRNADPADVARLSNTVQGVGTNNADIDGTAAVNNHSK